MVLSSMMMKYLNHDDPNLTVKVIDIDAPGTGRIPRTLIRPYTELEPESKRAFERGFEELKHRTNMKTGGITASDKRQMSISSLYGSRCVLVLSSKERGSAVTSASWKCTLVHYKDFKISLKFRVQAFTILYIGWTFTKLGVWSYSTSEL